MPVSNNVATIRTGTPIVIARLALPEAIEFREPQSHAAHDRVLRIERGTYDIVAICDWRSAFVAVRFNGTIVRSLWSGKPTGGEKPGDRAKATGTVYIYEVVRAAVAGTPSTRFWGGTVKLADGFKALAEDDGAVMCEATGELIILGHTVRAAEVPAHLAHVAKVVAARGAAA